MLFQKTLNKKTYFLGCACFFALFLGIFTLMGVQAQSASIASYDLSKAPKAMHGLKIPDFLAFATQNKEKTPLSAMVDGFVPSEISCAFDLNEKYLEKYHTQVAPYARFLESQGFKFNAGWEGYYHFDKKWQGYYVMITVGTYSYDTSGIKVGITLTKEKYVFPPHHNDASYKK